MLEVVKTFVTTHWKKIAIGAGILIGVIVIIKKLSNRKSGYKRY